ncbi:MAG: NAD(P)-dependent oxidoreductase [Chloroflexi bacterium]|nr:MAG: NAD(P)-dependent oxidoreductase [Chloroflexota bacterium]
MKQKIIITGGCGKIGSYFVKFASSKYAIRVVDRIAWDSTKHGVRPRESMVLDLQDLAACRQACAGMNTVIHLAADADPDANFEDSLLGNNIIATHNMFRAAKDAGCKRFIYASSAHVVSGYAPDIQVKSHMPINPKNEYGVTKCFGEALAAHFANSEGLPSIVLRIGAYIFPEEYEHFSLDEVDAFLDPDDFNELLLKCLETPNINFFVAHTISNNRYKRLDLTETRKVLGYQPQADAFEIFGMVQNVAN